ncbi:hypothetical protein LC653_23320 [Nostoc sp. CHAB 5784]|uniref:hypothetical protein n=1 Tax=Nostoc mirabile TaxID=2907820 RepID=UPI001E5B7DFD|nr:hypothetical protein [Nostoc mirabile]MCC5666739.1 hypothetical protein [Nostoc mirabile CHAB5784]
MMSQKKNDNNIPNYYLYGTVLTRYGLASLNHDIRRGNKTILQKGYWNGKIHSFVGSSAIRWALRFYLQKQGYLCREHSQVEGEVPEFPTRPD